MRACLLLAIAPAVLVLCALAACGRSGSIAEVDLLVSVSAGQTSVATGEGFPLTVTRIWRKDIEPSPWDDGVLSPLVVRAGETRRREDRLRVEETRTFRAYAFTLEDVSVPSVLFVGRSIGGSGKLLARSEPLSLRVAPALEAKAPGAPELPSVPRPVQPVGTTLAILLLVLVVVAAFYLRGWLGRTSRLTVGVAPQGEEQALALAQLARLSTRSVDLVSSVTRMADLLRQFVGVHYQVRLQGHTSEEILEALPEAPRAPLGDLLAACDRVKFAAHRPSAEEFAEMHSRAEAFLRSCGSEPA